MKLLNWESLPEKMRTEEVREYYDILCQKKAALFFKRLLDIFVSLVLMIILFPFFLIIALIIKIDSRGPVFYRQTRVTQYGKEFRIHKLRTMTVNSDKAGALTVNNDARITKVGKVLRKLRIDEICQIIDVFVGNMTLVGTRPEVPKYVEKYTPKMMATLLLPAGITSLASIFFKDEAKILSEAEDVEEAYVNEVLPQKMRCNLQLIRMFSFWGEIKIMFMTVFAVFGKKYEDIHQETVNESKKEISEETPR